MVVSLTKRYAIMTLVRGARERTQKPPLLFFFKHARFINTITWDFHETERNMMQHFNGNERTNEQK